MSVKMSVWGPRGVEAPALSPTLHSPLSYMPAPPALPVPAGSDLLAAAVALDAAFTGLLPVGEQGGGQGV